MSFKCASSHSTASSKASCRTHTSINTEIKDAVPFKQWPTLAFSKVSAQLVAEMFGMLTQQEEMLRCPPKICQGLGLFVIKEKVYMAKIKHDQAILSKINNSKINFGDHNGPHVTYSDWCFDLRKPNDRVALMVFLFHYKNVIKDDLRLRADSVAHDLWLISDSEAESM